MENYRFRAKITLIKKIQQSKRKKKHTGYSKWSDDVYTSKLHSYSRSASKGFDHDVAFKIDPVSVKVHKTLDPQNVKVRESRDSAEHPESLSIVVMIDVTGSMCSTPAIMRNNLGKLMSLLIKKGYVDHPQILFGAIGDATCDSVPLQIGQFESDDKMTDDLSNFILEGGGGGQDTESYELAMYVAARKTSMDCFEKRGKKGYAFIIGDENPYPFVKKDEVATLIGDKLQGDIPTNQIVEELKEKFEIFYIIPANTNNYGDTKTFQNWQKLFGKDRAIKIQDAAMISETIASLIGVNEGKVDLEELEGDLKDVGVDPTTAKSVSSALAPYARGSKSVTIKKATVSDNLPAASDGVSVEKV